MIGIKKIIQRIMAVIMILCMLIPANASAASSYVILSQLNAHSFVFVGKSYAGKKNAMISIAENLLKDGYEPAFIAGVMANVACEGSFGKFENINGYTETRLLEVYPNLKPCSETGNAHRNYIAHMNGFTTYDQCGHDHSEYRQYNKGLIYNGFSLKAIGEMLDRYAAENWTAQFGLGSLQWTGSRTATLFSFYVNEAANADTITAEQTAAAEMKMISYELSTTKKSVYTNWKSANPVSASEDAAYDAGYRVCYYYEVPSNRATASVTRGNIAREIYAVMAAGEEPIGKIEEITNNRDGTFTIRGYVCHENTLSEGLPIDIYINEKQVRTVSTSIASDDIQQRHRFQAMIDAAANGYVYHDYIVSAKVRLNPDDTEGISLEYAPDVLSTLTPVYDRTLQLPDQLVTIGSNAFSGIAARYVIIPDGVQSIGPGAFSNCPDLVAVEIPDSIRSIGNGAFTNSDKLTVICSAGSSVYGYAMLNGIRVRVR